VIDTSEEERPHIWVVEILEDGKWVTTDNAGTSLLGVQTQANEWKYCGAEDARVRRYVREEG